MTAATRQLILAFFLFAWVSKIPDPWASSGNMESDFQYVIFVTPVYFSIC
jgi:hypothetical protein